ncbi:hypothetical protein L5M11_15855 [Shewanella sp. SM87]|uniref:hypothetical protein n=1 Tax=Shewanella sp. SM87 TaxID=2912808 RepID=UPI0021DAFDD2|nr:hypothetical protein [Shewanella sp. SM87]MCU8008989.1 hypothetical protein [Shewanella sp. SM87]
MGKLTVRNVVNKVLDFELCKVKKYVFFSVVVISLYSLFVVTLTLKPDFDEYMSNRQISLDIENNQKRINAAKGCEESVISNGIKQNTLKYHIELHTCYYDSQGVEISPKHIEYLKKQWSKNPNDIRMYLDI